MDEVLEDADRNMRELWRGFAEVAGDRPVERDGLLLLTTGIPVPMFNPAFAVAPDADLPAAQRHYADQGVPFVVYFRDATAPGLAERCQAAGLVEHWQPPLMVLDPIPPAAAEPPDGLRIEIVTRATFDEYLATLCEGFGMPAEVIEPAFRPGVLDVEGFTGFLGRDDAGAPVTASAIFVTGETAGVYNVATVPSARGRGFGQAVTAAAARHGADHRGATRAILQASEAGRPVYARMGYEMPDRYRQFEG